MYMFQENGEGARIVGLLARLKLPLAIRSPRERLNNLAYHSFIKNCGGISSKFTNMPPEFLNRAPIFSNSFFWGRLKNKNNLNPEHHDDILPKICSDPPLTSMDLAFGAPRCLMNNFNSLIVALLQVMIF